jgi:hypothetical protein
MALIGKGADADPVREMLAWLSILRLDRALAPPGRIARVAPAAGTMVGMSRGRRPSHRFRDRFQDQ